MYVRAYNGVNSRWYDAALKQKSGKIKVAGKEYVVHYEPISGEINNQIDEAYKVKYATSPYLNSMISNRAKAATIKIVP